MSYKKYWTQKVNAFEFCMFYSLTDKSVMDGFDLNGHQVGGLCRIIIIP